MAGVCAPETVLRHTRKGLVAFQLQASSLVGVAAVNDIQPVRIDKQLIERVRHASCWPTLASICAAC